MAAHPPTPSNQRAQLAEIRAEVRNSKLKDDQVLSLFDLKNQVVLGSGTFGKVTRITHKKTGLPLALKTCLVRDTATLNRIKHELRCLAALHHPNIIEYITHFVKEFQEPGAPGVTLEFTIIMELAEGKQFLAWLEQGDLKLDTVRKLVAQLVDAVTYLHLCNWAHRDLKPENVMAVDRKDGTVEVKVLDLGWAKNTNDYLVTAGAGTSWYWSPEVIEIKNKHKGTSYTTQTDMWSIGVMTYELLVGMPPWKATKGVALENEICNFDPSKSLGKITDAQARDFIGRLLIKDASRRMTGAEARRHPFLADVKNVNGTVGPIETDDVKATAEEVAKIAISDK